MTVRLLRPFNGIPANAVATIDPATEAALVRSLDATTDLTGGLPALGNKPFDSTYDTPVLPLGLGVSPDASPSQVAGKIQAALDAGYNVQLPPGVITYDTTLRVRPRTVIPQLGNKGIGAVLKGYGAGVTVLNYVGPSTDPAILMDAPPSLGNRDYMSKLEGFSLVNPNTIGNVSGSGIEIRGGAATGEVNHTHQLSDLFINGFQYHLSLDDVTLPQLERVWFCEFGVAIRVGYNIDILRLNQCMFGSEQFGTSYRNSAVCIQTGWVAPFSLGSGDMNCLQVENSWFMKLGDIFVTTGQVIGPVTFKGCYFEDVRRACYFNTTSSVDCPIKFDDCNFNGTLNQFSSTDPTNPAYGALFHFEGVQATGVGAVPFLDLINCRGVGGRANASVSFIRAGRILTHGTRNTVSTGAFGQIRSVRTNFETWRTLPPVVGGTSDGTYEFMARANSAGFYKSIGEPIEISATIGSGTTYNLNYISGDRFVLTLPDGNCTIDHIAYSSTPPSSVVSESSRIQVELRVPGTVGATRTITWGARLAMNAATLTYDGTNVNQRCVIELVAYNTSNGFRLVSRDPAFVA